jgi:hypothetical protein
VEREWRQEVRGRRRYKFGQTKLVQFRSKKMFSRFSGRNAPAAAAERSWRGPRASRDTGRTGIVRAHQIQRDNYLWNDALSIENRNMGWLMNRKGFERKRSLSDIDIIPEFAWMDWGDWRETSERLAFVEAEVWIGILPRTNPRRHHLHQSARWRQILHLPIWKHLLILPLVWVFCNDIVTCKSDYRRGLDGWLNLLTT